MTHYYSETQEGPVNLKKIKANFFGIDFDIHTASGIFSKDRVDRGTRILIENAVVKNGARILDLGCGYGVVGIVLAKEHPNSKFTMVDINRRAIAVSNKNIKTNKIKNAEAFFSDGFSEIKETFDTILLNPPQTAGKKVCFSLIENSRNFLNEGGTLQTVARHNKGGAEFEKYMNSVFGNAKTIAKSGGYRVYSSEK